MIRFSSHNTNNASSSRSRSNTKMLSSRLAAAVMVAAVFSTTTKTTTTTSVDALTPSYSILSNGGGTGGPIPSSSSSSSSPGVPGVIAGFSLRESATNGDNSNDNVDNENDNLKSKSDTDLVNGSYYPYPSPPVPAEVKDETDEYAGFSYFTETSPEDLTETGKEATSTLSSDGAAAPQQPSSYNFLSVDGNGSGGLMGRSAGTGGTDATLMMGDTALNKATPVDSGSVHLPDTQQILKQSSLTEVSGNSVVRGDQVETRVATNESDEPVALAMTPPDDDSTTSLHVSNTIFGSGGTNVIPTILKRYVPPAPTSETGTTSTESLSSSSSSFTGTSTGGANHFRSPTPPQIKVRRFVPGQDDAIFKHPEPKQAESTHMMQPVRKLKPYEKPVSKPAAAFALPEGAVAVSTTTDVSGTVPAVGTGLTTATTSASATTTKPESTKLVRVVSKDTTSTIPNADPKDRYCNEYTPPTSATLHLKTGLQVDTPVSLWQPRDKFLDH